MRTVMSEDRCWWLGLMVMAIVIASSPVIGQLPTAVLDTELDETATPDVAIDHDGRVVVSYRDGRENALKVARGTRCPTIETLCDQGRSGMYSSIEIDSMGLPHIVHGPGSSGGYYEVLYTLDGRPLFDLSTLTVAITASVAPPVFALDQQDRPFVTLCRDRVKPIMVYFDIQSGEWLLESLPGGALLGAQTLRSLTLAVDHSNRPVVAFQDQSELIVVATLENGGWSTRTHEFDQYTEVSGLALDFDATNAPCLAYANAAYDRVEFLRFGLFNVTQEIVVDDVAAKVGPHSMAIDSANRIRIVYADTQNQSLRLATREFGWWTTLIEAGTTDSSAEPAIAIDSDDDWVVAYYDAVNEQLKVAGPDFVYPTDGDSDCDGDVDLDDASSFVDCLFGPGVMPVPVPPVTTAGCLQSFDLDADNDVDLADWSGFTAVFGG